MKPLTTLVTCTKEGMKLTSSQILLYQNDQPQRIKNMLLALKGLFGGFAVDQLQHSLQTATRASRAGASEEMILLSLCHDIGKVINWPNHGAIAAEILKPYVSENAYWILQNHQDFQGRSFYQFFGMDPNLYLKYKDHPAFELAVQFSDWDQAAFDPNYDTLPLEHFHPLIDRFFSAVQKEYTKAG